MLPHVFVLSTEPYEASVRNGIYAKKSLGYLAANVARRNREPTR